MIFKGLELWRNEKFNVSFSLTYGFVELRMNMQLSGSMGLGPPSPSSGTSSFLSAFEMGFSTIFSSFTGSMTGALASDASKEAAKSRR